MDSDNQHCVQCNVTIESLGIRCDKYDLQHRLLYTELCREAFNASINARDTQYQKPGQFETSSN